MGFIRSDASLLPYTLNLNQLFINTLEHQKPLLLIRTHIASARKGQYTTRLHVFHYKIAHNSFIFYQIFNFKIFSYGKIHCLQVVLYKSFSYNLYLLRYFRFLQKSCVFFFNIFIFK